MIQYFSKNQRLEGQKGWKPLVSFLTMCCILKACYIIHCVKYSSEKELKLSDKFSAVESTIFPMSLMLKGCFHIHPSLLKIQF